MAKEFIESCGPKASLENSELANPGQSVLSCFFSAPHIRHSFLYFYYLTA